MTEETQVTISCSGFTSVPIWCTKLDHNLDKPIINIPIAAGKDSIKDDSYSLDRWNTYLIDIGRVKEIITVQGFLADDSTTSGLTKKNNLFLIAGNSSDVDVIITWGSDTDGLSQNEQSRKGTIQKVGVTETAGKVGTEGPIDGDSGEKNFAVQFGFMVGTNK